MSGWFGHLLDVDLSTGAVGQRPIPAAWCADFLGGRGLGVRLLWELLPAPGVDPLGPDNPLMFLPGPLSGFPVPSASRTCVVTKSPCTAPARSPHAHASTVSYSNIGGFFGPALRFAGHDGLLLRGQAPEPVVLVIDGHQAELRPAGALWGLGTDAFERAFKEQLGSREYEVVSIGPAGEARCSRACILHTAARAAGRGVGAVMGAKRLKGIAVRGARMPTVQDHRAFLRALERSRRRFEGLTGRLYAGIYRRAGTAVYLQIASNGGIMAVRNYREGTFPEVGAIGAKATRQQVWVRSSACRYCHLACKKSGQVRDGPYVHTVHDGPEYETGTMFGANLLLDDLGGVLRACTLGDELGLDIIATGNALGFLMEAREKGHLDPSILEGVDLRWGAVDPVLEMIRRIARRDGVGDLISQGTRTLSWALGSHTAPYAIHVKGLELAAHNVHANPKRGLCYATSNRGACHLSGDDKHHQDFAAAADSTGVCLFAATPGGLQPGIGAADFAALLTAVTGDDWDEARFLRTGERIFALERLFNQREGFTVADDTLPERFFTEPLTVGKRAGAVLDRGAFEESLRAWRLERGYDPEDGHPGAEKLAELGLAAPGAPWS
ncbi:MAG: aldehyde ferredoxin oxidoreductase C-terminal domain-containing protein [Pseudomonadota bacterium]